MVDAPGNGSVPRALLALALASTFAIFTPCYQHLNSDSFIPSMVSLYHWTPFYWQQDRYGMLIPLLLTPIANPLLNFLAHCWISFFLGLASFLLIARHAFGDKAPWALIGLAGAASFLLLAPPAYSADCLAPAIFYPPSICLGLLSLLCIERLYALPMAARRERVALLIGACLLVAAAHWINSAVGMLLLALIAGKALFSGKPDRSQTLVEIGLVLAGSLLGYALTTTSPYHQAEAYRLLPLHQWPYAWLALVSNDDRGAAGLWRAFPIGAALLAALAVKAVRKTTPSPRAALALLSVALVYSIAVSCTRLAAFNGFAQRYLQPSLVLFWVALIGYAWISVEDFFSARVRALAPWFVGAALIVCVPIGLGGVANPANSMRQAFGESLAAVQTEQCSVIAGDYWRVWPTLLLANAALYEEAHPSLPPLRAIAMRTPYLWSGREPSDERLRVCMLDADEASAVEFLASFGIRAPRFIKKSGNMSVFEI